MLRFYKFIIFEIRTAAKRRGNSPLRRQIMGGKKLFFLYNRVSFTLDRKCYNQKGSRASQVQPISEPIVVDGPFTWVRTSSLIETPWGCRRDPFSFPVDLRVGPENHRWTRTFSHLRTTDSAPRPCPRSVCEGRLLARLQGHAGGHGIARETPRICLLGAWGTGNRVGMDSERPQIGDLSALHDMGWL